MRVLVVDDESLIATSLERYLSGMHHDVTATTSPEAAAALIEKERFDVVVSDVTMEPIDGIELVRRLRSLDPHCRVILMSGTARWEDIEEEVENLNVAAFIEKPFDLRYIRDKLKEFSYENERL